MLPKAKRLTVQDFKDGGQFVFFSTPYFDIKIKKAEKTKYAVVVSSKRFKKAVERNKIKRIYYRVFRQIIIKNNYIVIVYPKKETKSRSFLELHEKLQSVYTELHLQ